MFKIMFFLYRRADWGAEEFQRYSSDVHVPLVSKVPGLQRYVVNHTLANPGGVEHACDGVAELWFASAEAFQAALGSAEGAAALADQANYLDMGRTHALIVGEQAIL